MQALQELLSMRDSTDAHGKRISLVHQIADRLARLTSESELQALLEKLIVEEIIAYRKESLRYKSLFERTLAAAREKLASMNGYQTFLVPRGSRLFETGFTDENIVDVVLSERDIQSRGLPVLEIRARTFRHTQDLSLVVVKKDIDTVFVSPEDRYEYYAYQQRTIKTDIRRLGEVVPTVPYMPKLYDWMENRGVLTSGHPYDQVQQRLGYLIEELPTWQAVEIEYIPK